MQSRLRDYKETIESFPHNIFNLGLHKPGRYMGFDSVLINVNPLQFQIRHNGTNGGLQYKDPNNTIVGPIGVALTPQGTLIIEDELVETLLTINTNAGNPSVRYDLVVLNHSQVQVAGGQAATYSIIQGNVGSSEKPVLTDPLKQTLLGWWEIPAGATTLNPPCKYVKAKCPDSGDGEDARIETPNFFQSIQSQKKSGTTLTVETHEVIASSITAHLWELENDGNVFDIMPLAASTFDGFKIKDITPQNGTRIYIRANSNLLFRNMENWVPTFGAQGFKPLNINQSMGNTVTEDSGQGNRGVKPAAGEIWELEFVYDAGKWYLSKIGGVSGAGSGLLKGMTIPWYGDLTTDVNFDETGLGVNLMTGFQISNGLLDTPDLRGLIPYQAATVPSVGAAALPAAANEYIPGNAFDTQGLTDFLITKPKLPNIPLVVNDPGHRHPFVGVDTVNTAGGGSSTRRCGDFNKLTSLSVTGITVTLDGGGERLTHLPPLFGMVYITKL